MVKSFYISAKLICRGRKGGGWCEDLRRRSGGSIKQIINYIHKSQNVEIDKSSDNSQKVDFKYRLSIIFFCYIVDPWGGGGGLRGVSLNQNGFYHKK